MPRIRHLPPTAVPVTASDLLAGLQASGQTPTFFQNGLASYLGVESEAIMTAASGRTALYYLLKGLKSERPARTEVIMPAYTCPALARVALDLKLQPVYVDLSPETWRYIPEKLAAAGAHTLAVLLVHPFGIPLAMEDVIEIAHSAGAVVIEDAAQAFGARWAGRPVGTRGDFGLYSLGPGKPISTGGGGFVSANHPEAQVSLNAWKSELPPPKAFTSVLAWTRQSAFQIAFHPIGWWAATKAGLHRAGQNEASWGYSLQGLTAVQAGVGLALLPRLDEINTKRRYRASVLENVIGRSNNLQSIKIDQAATAVYLRFPLLAENNEQRERLYEAFWAAGIGAGRMYEKTLPEIFPQTISGDFPGATAIARRLLTLPTHHFVEETDLVNMTRIIAAQA